ncbi:MAG: M14 family zinc carboxypeptidase [Candidatus Hermodarchaeota archaeon]
MVFDRLKRLISVEPEETEWFPDYTDYKSWEDITAILRRLHEEHPNITELKSLGESVKSKDLWLMTISKHLNRLEGKKGVFIVGCHHGREVISAETATYILEWILGNLELPDIKNAINHGFIQVMLMHNPDGRKVVTRKNANKVDLNRNYTFRWGEDGASHWPGSEIYCGSDPLSEPETKILDKLFKDSGINRIPYSVTYHSGIEAILYPWGDKYEDAPDLPEILEIGLKTELEARKRNLVPLEYYQSVELYPATGTMEDHVYAYYDSLCFCVEVYRGSGSVWDYFNPPKDQINTVCQRNIPLIVVLLRSLLEH